MDEEVTGLTDSESRIARAVYAEMKKDLRLSVGKSVLDHVWKAIIVALIIVALYAMGHGGSLKAP